MEYFIIGLFLFLLLLFVVGIMDLFLFVFQKSDQESETVEKVRYLGLGLILGFILGVEL